jgi:hypothetical protein
MYTYKYIYIYIYMVKERDNIRHAFISIIEVGIGVHTRINSMSANVSGEGNMPRAGKSHRRPNRSPENRHERHEKRGRPCVKNCWSAANDENTERKRGKRKREKRK